jgi:hypothetical protein
MSHLHGSQPIEPEPCLLPLRSGGDPNRIDQIVREVVAEAKRERTQRMLPEIPVETDIAAGHATSIDADTLRACLLPLVRAACQATALSLGTPGGSPGLTEVVVTSIDTGTAIEIEVADSGTGSPGDAAPATEAAVAKVRALADRYGGGVEVAACPEGGLAVTLRFPHRRVRGMAA